MPNSRKPSAQMIAPDAYPQMIGRKDAERALTLLRSDQLLEKAQAGIDACVPPLRAALLDYVDALEKAEGDQTHIYDTVHEIRGFAETAGLPVTGRLAESLCRYLDTMERNGKAQDGTIAALHVAAIIRTARAGEGEGQMGDLVVDELTALVTRRLAEAGCA
jgi:hypothetical protein